MSNPLLVESSHEFGAVSFDVIKPEHFIPALDQRITEAKANVDKIKGVAQPTFESVIVPLAGATRTTEEVASVFYNLNACHGTPEIQALAKTIMPKLSALENDINLDAELFGKVKEAYEGALDRTDIDKEDRRLLRKIYRGFVRNGALLGDDDKAQLRQIDKQLAALSPQFHENILKATNDFALVIEKQEDLAGLPESAIEAAAATAKEKGHDGKHVFTLHAPSVMPFLKFADNAEKRQEIWLAYNKRSHGGEFSNLSVIKEIIDLRFKRARLLGYKSHAEFQLEERMAETPSRVQEFLNDLLKASKPAAENELAELAELKKAQTGDDQLQPWDWHYYSNKLKEQKYSYNEEDLRPYFELNKALQGIFLHAEKLYGLKFEPLKNLPKYHADTEVFKVTNESNGYMGLFYVDFFPRETKGQGAWCTRYRDQGVVEGEELRPHVSIVCNFTKPTATKPALLTFNEVNTLFHEFGHALHSLLSQVKYPSLSGTKVYRDFVELPSQVMENWILEKESLALFASHFETGEILPDDFIEKIRKSSQFQAGLLMLRQLKFGLLDMAYHDQDPAGIDDIEKFEQSVTKEAELLPLVEGTAFSPSFSHIFAGGYSAGYYSYKWAEVLDADAFEMFKENGLFDSETAEKFRQHILSKGDSDHPMELYKQFRGREPDPKALLRRAGLVAS